MSISLEAAFHAVREMKGWSRHWLAVACLLGLSTAASADVLFENVRIFDGKGSTTLSAPSNVLVQGNVIARISTDPIEAEGVRARCG